MLQFRVGRYGMTLMRGYVSVWRRAPVGVDTEYDWVRRLTRVGWMRWEYR